MQCLGGSSDLKNQEPNQNLGFKTPVILTALIVV